MTAPTITTPAQKSTRMARVLNRSVRYRYRLWIRAISGLLVGASPMRLYPR
jgi:hypothetical protein